jgi:hypothetical protein
MKAWYTSCTCPGAEVARQRLDDAGIKVRDFAEMREERQRRSRAGKEAVAATRARAAGKSREEIREIYIAELHARNLKVPAEAVLDAAVDHITGNPLPAIRVLGEACCRWARDSTTFPAYSGAASKEPKRRQVPRSPCNQRAISPGYERYLNPPTTGSRRS